MTLFRILSKLLCTASGLALCAGLAGCTTLGALAPDGESEMRSRAAQQHEEMLASLRERNRERDAARAQGEGTPRRSSKELVREGDRLRSSGDLAAAAVTYLRAHHVDKAEIMPLRRIAYLALEREPAEASELFYDLLERDPHAADLNLGMAIAKLAAGDLHAAGSYARHARERDPDAPVMYEVLGVIHDRAGRHEDAQRAYRTALEIGGPDPRTLNNLGVSCLISGDYDEAVASFERALARGARDPAVGNNLGLALGLAGRYHAALAQFKEGGTQGDGFNNLGLVFFLRGDYAAAKESYERALLSNDTDERRVLRNLEVLEQSHRDGRI